MALANLNETTFKKTNAALAFSAMVLAGCTQASDLNQSGGLTPQASVGNSNRAARPLQPAPLTPVNQGVLEPVQTTQPTPPPAQTEIAKIEPIPEAPKIPTTQQAEPQISEANAQPVTKQAMLGFWDVRYQGTNCKMFLNLTPQGGNWRGGTLRCPDSLRSNIKAWNVKGKRVILYDGNGAQVASLLRTSPSSFSGVSSAGGTITAAREG